MTEPLLDLRCPQCRQLDQVSKVSAVFAQGTSVSKSEGRAIGGGYQFGNASGPIVQGTRIDMHGASRTVLSQRLAPIPPPAPGGNIVTIGIMFLAGVLTISCLNISSSVADGSGQLVVQLLIGLAIIWLAAKARQRFGKPTMPMSEWEEYMRNWKASYYCGRCDKVFLPAHDLKQ